MHVRYLVTDYDDCAYSATSMRADSLSQPIVDMALAGDYDGFYGCTHRAYGSYQYADRAASVKRLIGYPNSAANLNFPTYVITKNFAAATSLRNMAVSTLDDLLYQECGEAYTKVLKPFEVFKVRPVFSVGYIQPLGIPARLGSKNFQLTQIAKHAAALHPGAEIVLDYVDDKESLGREAIAASAGREWPGNVFLNIYHYTEMVVRPIYEPERFFEPALEDEFFDASDEIPEEWLMGRSALQVNSLFGTASQPEDVLVELPKPIQSTGI